MGGSITQNRRAKIKRMENNIHLENPAAYAGLQDKLCLKLVNWILTSEKQGLWNITIVFVDEKYIIDLNRRFFHKSTPTDVISFNLSDPQTAEGEVYISVDTARTNSIYFDVSLDEELFRLIAHGVYHLLEYNDKTEEEKRMMTALENKALDYIYSPSNFEQNV